MNKNPFASKGFLYLLGLAFLIYTGYRTVDLVSKTLPADAVILSVIAVLAFDGGIVAWGFYFSRGAKSQEQITIAQIMVAGDFCGMAILFISHTLLNEKFYEVSADTLTFLGTVVIWTLVVGVLLNIGALLAVHAYDPDEQIARARRDIEAEVHKRAVELIKAQANQIAGEIAPSIAQQTVDNTRSQKMGRAVAPTPIAQIVSSSTLLPSPKRGRGRPRKIVSQPEEASEQHESPLQSKP